MIVWRIFTIVLVGLGDFFQTQAASAEPAKWTTYDPLNSSPARSRVKLPHNQPGTIRQELLDPQFLPLVAKAAGLSTNDLATVRLATGNGGDTINLYQIGKATNAVYILGPQLKAYIQEREDGHTRELLMGALTNQTLRSKISDPDLQVLLRDRPLLLAGSFKKTASGAVTIPAGQILSTSMEIISENGQFRTNKTTKVAKTNETRRLVTYTLVDGEIAWSYTLSFNPDGSLDDLRETKSDAKEYDPKYDQIMLEVKMEIDGEMKSKGTYRQINSAHTFWNLKKEKLKARGIPWRSPGELNPTSRDD